MTLKRCVATAGALLIAAGSGVCQPAPPGAGRGQTAYYEDTNNIPVSPEVHPDHTVTFRFFAPKASEVVLNGSPGILEAIKEPKPLQKDAKGVWSVTVGPLAPGFYTYGYAIDGGLRMPDPSNPDLEMRRWGDTSMFIVPGDEKAVFEERPVPHGTVHVNFYDSLNLKTPRMFYVYTPPGYETGKQKYPVLYLLHGNGQIEASWTWTGKANVILHNLDQFAYIGAFSGGGNRAEWEKMDAGTLNKKLKVLWLGCGREDKTVSFASVQNFVDMLMQKNVQVTFNPSGGGHSWPNWQVYLSKYAPLLFKD